MSILGKTIILLLTHFPMQKQIFEEIKQLNEFGQEYRMARALSKVLHYADFGNFEKVIQKAKITCEHS
jgi:DNA-damage-inducible protein D